MRPIGRGFRIILASLLIMSPIALYVLVLEPNNLRVINITLYFPDLPEDAEGLTIVHISDLHLHRIGHREKAVLRIIEENTPDIIALTGDFISRRRDKDECIEFLAKLEARLGLWAVQGNWEHYTQWRGDELRKDLQDLGITLLINEAEAVQVGNDTIWIAGTDDPSLGRDRIPESLDGTKGGFVILLAHSPDVMNRAPDTVRLILSGHTHGGQVRIPLIGAPWAKRMGGGYLSGIYRRNDTVLYVSNGVGMAHLPIRFLCPPDIVYITLRSLEAKT